MFIAVFLLLGLHQVLGVTVTQDTYGYLGNQSVLRYRFTNSANVTVDIITYGGRIAVVRVPDINGNIDDVVLGYDTLEGYTQQSDPYFSAILGRVANRIGGASFEIDGVRYSVTVNDGRNQLHGGLVGFDKVVWDSYLQDNCLILSYLSKDGEEGFPGAVLTQVTYNLTEDSELYFSIRAMSTKSTPINIANHAYFNLAGQASGRDGLFQHVVTLNADQYTVTNGENIPTGEIASVDGTDLDFRTAKELGPLIQQRGGYDNNFVVNNIVNKVPVLASRVEHPQTGRYLEVWTNQPGVQMYTGNGLPTGDSLFGKGGVAYHQYGSISLETQNFPDAMNHENFPNSILRPGDIYEYTTIYKFGVQQSTSRRR